MKIPFFNYQYLFKSKQEKFIEIIGNRGDLAGNCSTSWGIMGNRWKSLGIARKSRGHR